MGKKTAWVLCRQIGGAQNAMVLSEALTECGWEVQLFADTSANAMARVVLDPRGANYRGHETVSELLIPQFRGNGGSGLRPDVFITTMCPGPGYGRELVHAFKKQSVLTVGIQDFWGARLDEEKGYGHPDYRPDIVCVNDDVGRAIVKETWGPDARVAVTGYPRLDAIAMENREDAAAEVRKAFEIEDGRPIVYYQGQIADAGYLLGALMISIMGLEQPCHLLLREHARMKESRGEKELWDTALRAIPEGVRVVHITDPAIPGWKIGSAANVVFGKYPTDAVDAAAIGKQVICFLGSQQEEELRRETGNLPAMPTFPLVTLGCAVKVETQEELAASLRTALSGDLGLRENQNRAFRLDGNCSTRVIEEIERVLRH